MKTTCRTALTALVALALLAAGSRAQQTAPPVEPVPGAVDSTTAPAVEAGGSDAGSQAPSFGNSKVRIVRLSQVNGAVQMDRNTGHGFEAAMQNLPVVEGTKLKTDNGLAEVEFEDNSSLRVTPST